MDLLYEIHSNNPREGPGNNESTEKAFSFVKDHIPSNPKILDIGCGPGFQTLELARISKGTVTAVDNHKPYLNELKRRAEKETLSDKVKIVEGSMFDLRFKEKSFDLIWSEGAIYIMGFEKGLSNWKRFLKPGGFMVVSELSWFKDNPPAELKKFWDEGYPAAQSVKGNLDIIKKSGYEIITHFHLPEEAWWADYYTPLEKRVNELKIKYRHNKEILKQLDEELYEIELYRKYSDYYGYEFYIMKLVL